VGSPTNPTVDKFGRAVAKVDYSPAGPSNRTSFAFDHVQPPSIVYIQRDDVLVVQAATSQTNEVVTFNVRILQPDGRIEESQFILRPASARASVSLTLTVSEGYLISLAATASVAITRGQTFARAFINRAIFGATSPAQTIFADYVTTLVSSGYPNGRVLAPTEGPGWVYSVTRANPAAGQDWTITLPANTRWRIRTVFAQLLTSATVVNRNVSLAISGTANFALILGALATQTAGQQIQYTGLGLPPTAQASTALAGLPLPPDLVLASTTGSGHQLGSNTTAMQAGDQWSQINMLVEEWLDNV
jgi:hypothetical protein